MSRIPKFIHYLLKRVDSASIVVRILFNVTNFDVLKIGFGLCALFCEYLWLKSNAWSAIAMSIHAILNAVMDSQQIFFAI